MGIFEFNDNELLTFFAVLVRFSVLIAVMPVVGDQLVPGPLKILLSLVVSFALYPALVGGGQVTPAEAETWAASGGTLVFTIGREVLFGLTLGFIARLFFDAIGMGANVAGTFMGFAMANTYDPHQQTQTQVVAKLQVTLATLIFLVLDGHHLMLRAALDSYSVVDLGGLNLGGKFAEALLAFTGMLIRVALQIAAPMALSLFSVNVVYGVMAKAMPQLNILVLSFAVSAFVGLFVMLASVPAFHEATGSLFRRMGSDMTLLMRTMQ